MNHVATIDTVAALPALVKKAADTLASATTAAEILDARDLASAGYDAAKKAAQMARKRQAHDEVIAKATRAQADLLEIEAGAKRLLADEYDAAVARGEMAGHGGARNFKIPDENLEKPTVTDAGITTKQIHEAHQIQKAEQAEPGIVRRVLDERIASGLEPNRAALREAVVEAAKRGQTDASGTSSKNPLYQTPTVNGAAWTHLYGACRALTEWSATGDKITLALRGVKERQDDQTLNIAAVRKCASLLNLFLEELENAE